MRLELLKKLKALGYADAHDSASWAVLISNKKGGTPKASRSEGAVASFGETMLPD